MKVHFTDELGNIVQSINVANTLILDDSQGNTLEVCTHEKNHFQLWAGRRPWVNASKDIMFKELWKRFIIEPKAGNSIDIKVTD